MVKGVAKNTFSLTGKSGGLLNTIVQAGGILGKIGLENLGIAKADTFTKTTEK